jgi:uncharacterized protein
MAMRSWITLAALFVAGWLGGAAVQAQSAKARTVQDDVGMFSAKAKAEANAEIARIYQNHKKDLMIEAAQAPARPDDVDKDDKAAVKRFFDKWTAEKFNNEKINGVYVVIVPKAHIVRAAVGQETLKAGLFTNKDRDELIHKIHEKLDAGDKDGALHTATGFVADTMQHHARPAVNAAPGDNVPAGQHAQNPPHHKADASPIVKWVLIGLAILLGFWLISAVMRGFSSLGGGGGGGPGYGYGGGGGGGGFMNGFLGGLFGAAAGMWMYNNFFGHSTSSAWGGESHTGGGAAASEPSDVGAGDPSVGGGDYDEPDKGAEEDAGGGGGDWGGGGDTGGGGGDWGGGGGDAGGGGDWGGGGGGDWGGGGGGGDW